jgi:uncharacterized protein YdhG (YjbR/CyaY superfamily)
MAAFAPFPSCTIGIMTSKTDLYAEMDELVCENASLRQLSSNARAIRMANGIATSTRLRARHHQTCEEFEVSVVPVDGSTPSLLRPKWRLLCFACPDIQPEGVTMQSTAPTVDAYLEEVPAPRRAVLTAIRDLCRRYLPDYEEGMRYGMPGYARDGVVEIAFASQKQYLAIYGLKSDALAAVRDEIAGASIGKGCIRYRKPEQVNLDAIAQLLQATAASDGAVC